jgi:hypothetical protein
LTSKTKKSPEYNYTCCKCNTPYTGRRSQPNKSKRFCTDACRQAKAYSARTAEKKQSRIEEQLTRWYKSAFGVYVIGECRKAGTVGILLGNTTATLFELETLHNRYYKCYGYNREEKKSAFNRCHVQARKGKDGSIGALHPSNLFIGASLINQEYGNKFVSADAGLRIPAKKLTQKMEVLCSDNDQQVAAMIRKLLKAEFTDYLSQSAAIVMKKEFILARQIFNRQQKGTAVRDLGQRYSKAELENLDYEKLELMDAHQRGKDSVSRFQPELYTRASLCVYAEELERFAGISPSERQRDNCRFMLGLVRVLGVFLAQRVDTQQGLNHGSFLRLRDMDWRPLEYINWQQPWGRPTRHLVDTDQKMLIDSITVQCFHALAGADIPKGFLKARLLKRIDVATLVPTVMVPTDDRYKAFGSWEKFIEGLYADAEPVWQSLLELGLCSIGQVEGARTGLLESLSAAIRRGRQEYKNQSRFRRIYKGKHYTDWGFNGYPDHLEDPALLTEKPGQHVHTAGALTA